jgi:2-methylcitrate dehydratase PrpD
VIETAGRPTQELADVLSDLQFRDLPGPVVERTKELFLDWVGSALAGRGARAVTILEDFAATMGPADGPSEVVTSRASTSPLFAALVNGAASHVVEQDDVHNGAVFHPGTVVFPAILAAGQSVHASGCDLITAAVVGYEMGVRVGSFLGRSHYRVFHTTGTAGTLAAAAGVAHILGLDATATRHALGSAGTQAAGLWEFLRDAADSKQLHTAKAASDGLLSAYLARAGFTGAQHILEGPQGMAAGMSQDADPGRLTEGLGERWAVLETSFKFHASCRHTHPAADALRLAMEQYDLSAADIAHVTAYVHRAAVDVLGPVTDPRTIHHAKFSMGFVLALIALRGQAGVTDFTEDTLRDPAIRDFHDRVSMRLDPEIDALYPKRWVGLVEVDTTDGRNLVSRVDLPKGDPENTLSRPELERKARHLAAYRKGATPAEMEVLMARTWRLDSEPDVGRLLPRAAA